MGTNESSIKCEKCGSQMREVGRERKMAEVDYDDLTEGQMADYEAACLSGDNDDWAETEIYYVCEKCSEGLIVVIS